MKRSRIVVGVLLAGVLVSMLVGVVFVQLATHEPMVESIDLLQSDDLVVVDVDGTFTFSPNGEEPGVGLVFYPGGLVDPRAYAPAARILAEQGHLVIVVPMPLNLAVLAPYRGMSAIEEYPTIDRWAVGGHSLGGAMAAGLAAKYSESIDGLVLWAAYPASSVDLSATELAALSISATRDGIAAPDEIERSRLRLPEDTVWVSIDGGNHAQFGWYGTQRGDQTATISREEQQRQIVDATSAFLQSLIE